MLPTAANTCFIPLKGTTVISSLILDGVIPSSPLRPQAAVTIQGLELFRIVQLRCPSLSVQAWVKTLCDLHGVSF